MPRMDRKHVIVTGGANGIGRGIALRLVTAGWNVSIFDIDSDAAEALVADEADIGFHKCDVADEDDVRLAVAAAVERHGRLDAIINNAGIADPERGPMERLSLDAWQRVIDVNLTGVFLCSKHAIPHLVERGGAIVNIASTRALMSEANTEAYSASKGGIVALTHAMAISLGPAVRVNCISPGWIDTTGSTLRPKDHVQHPAGRVGRPDDIAALVKYLIGDESGFVTGQNFVVDGGMTRKMIYEH